MPKTTTIFVCSNCGFKSPRWQGKCPNCGEWNTLEEQRAVAAPRGAQTAVAASPVILKTVEIGQRQRIATGISEFDDVLGGGIVPGSLILLGGDPGIGKSTLALQLSMHLAQDVLYVSGEESVHQIKLRANRLEKSQELQVLSETDLEAVLATVEARQPKLAVIDSVQTMY
jgi:DNA repair protein RadA/Sms